MSAEGCAKKRLTRAAAHALAVAALFVNSSAQADVLSWDANGNSPPNPAGGAGTWSASSNNWWNGFSIQQYSAGSGPHDTIFNATAGAVTISGSVTAQSLAFNVNGYSLSGGTLNLANSGIVSVAGAADTLAISSIVSGAGLTKTGAGKLTLSATNTYNGLTIGGGTVSFGAAAHLGNASGGVTINGGALQLTGASAVTTPATRNFILGPGSATIDVINTSSTGLTIDGLVSGVGALVKTGTGTLRLDGLEHEFIGGVTHSGGVIRFNNNNEAGPIALRCNRINFQPPAATIATLALGGSGGSSTGEGSELRLGELSYSSGGPANLVAATTTTDTMIGAHGHDIMIFALADASYAGTVQNLITSNGGAAGTNSTHGELQVRGLATQTLRGNLSVNNTITVSGPSAGLTVAGNSELTGSGVNLQLKGGTFTLDNASFDNPQRFNNAGVIESRGGGTFGFIGSNTVNSSEIVGQMQLGTATAARSGQLNVKLTHTVIPAGVSTVLTFAGVERASGRATVDFSARNAAGGATLPLGTAGNAPRVMFTAAPATAAGSGLLSANGTGWATVNGTDFATYGVNGIAPVATTAFASAGASSNALLTATASISSTKEVASLKIAPSAASQTLDLTGAANLDTPAILHTGANNFTIRNVGGTGGLTTLAAARYVFVQQAALTIATPVSGTAALVKSGDGTLVLSATNSYSGATTLNGGNLRIASNGSLGSGTLELRGGVLELAGGGTFNRHLDQGQPPAGSPGLISWNAVGPALGQTSETDRGSGGFAAVGSNAIVDINGLGATDMSWEQPSFLSSGYALLLGSKNATARVDLIDNFGFGLGVSSYNTREIRVIDNPASSSDVARISGIVFSDTPANGGRLHDLLKSGDGVLELTGNNTYHGGTIVAEGTLLLGYNNALGNASAPYVLLGSRGGAASASLLTGAAVTIDRDITVQSGSSGVVSLGGSSAHASTFAGDVAIQRSLTLTAAAGGTTTFTGQLNNVAGAAITKSGGGVVRVNNLRGGGVSVTAGKLLVTPDGSSAGTSRVTSVAVSGGTLDLTNNKLIVAGGAIGSWNGSAYTGVTGLLQSGRGNGSWNGNGIVTSMSSATSSVLTALAVATAEDAGRVGQTFGGISVSSGDVLVMYTWGGDADLNGELNGDDYFYIDSNINSQIKSYHRGDFDYNGVINGDDYFIIDSNVVNAQNSPPFPAGLGGLASVPEPPGLALLVGAALCIRRRRLARPRS